MFSRLKTAWRVLKGESVIDRNPLFAPYPSPRKTSWGTTSVHMDDVNAWHISMRKGLANYAPDRGYSRCHSCNLPWWAVTNHVVYYSGSRGCFAICEQCWRELPRKEAFQFYHDLLMDNGGTGEEQELLRKNILGEVTVK